jgi:hypothetical protein
MDLLILKKSLGSGQEALSTYRGTERTHPTPFAKLPESHVANQLFYWFVDEGGPRGVVHDLKKAKQLVELLNLFGDAVFYEIVQVGTERQVTPGKGGFLGFDVSAGFNNSMVRRLLLQERGGEFPAKAPAADQAVCQLAKLQKQFFTPKLNDHRLFQSYDEAEFCLRTARALNTLRPGWIEGTDLAEYEVTSLYKVL